MPSLPRTHWHPGVSSCAHMRMRFRLSGRVSRGRVAESCCQVDGHERCGDRVKGQPETSQRTPTSQLQSTSASPGTEGRRAVTPRRTALALTPSPRCRACAGGAESKHSMLTPGSPVCSTRP